MRRQGDPRPRDRAEPALPEMPGPAPPCVGQPRIAPMNPGQRPSKAFAVGRGQDQVDVVGHQTPCPNPDPGVAARLPEKIECEIVIRKKRPFAAVAALGDVIVTATLWAQSECGYACDGLTQSLPAHRRLEGGDSREGRRSPLLHKRLPDCAHEDPDLRQDLPLRRVERPDRQFFRNCVFQRRREKPACRDVRLDMPG
jgi:hypothetical protein